MNREHRTIFIADWFLGAYGCIWIPWPVELGSPQGAYERIGYGWVWAGPYRSASIVYDPATKASEGWQILSEEDSRSSWADLTAEPNPPLMALRFIAATAFAAAAFLSAGLLKAVKVGSDGS